MNERYFIVHWLGQKEPDDDILEDDEFEFDDYDGGMLLRGKLFVRTRGRYVNEQRAIEMITEQQPSILFPYVDRVEELRKEDYFDFVEGNPAFQEKVMQDPNAPRDFT